MGISKYIHIRNIALLFCIVLLLNCSGNKTKQEKQTAVKVIQLEKVDGTYLFDGNTLNGWEITQFGTQGPVDVFDGKIVMNYGDGCTGITWEKDFPKVNYEVNLEARKTSGNDFFCGITFPVNDDFCSLIVGGWGGPVVGLSCIDGEDASENSTHILKRFDKDVWYKIKLQVTSEKITAWIDDEKLVDFAYEGHELYVRPEVELSKPFGICSWITTSELRNIWMKRVTDN
ncbi:MAG: DUF1080 domain-containing protein [Bacteroidetes bacterium]|nr:DUF1080 domain-containing protein [Bacteroidota bacterium]